MVLLVLELVLIPVLFPLAVIGDLVNLLCPFIDAVVVFNALILVDIARRDRIDVGFIVVDGDLLELL